MTRHAKEKVLVVEDEPDFVRLMQYTFQKAGYRVFCAGDGESGLELARTVKPDLFILDMMLPGMDGMELCRLLRLETQSPIIMLTAKKSDADRLACQRLGADEYLTKPTAVRDLLARVRGLLECRLQRTSRS